MREPGLHGADAQLPADFVAFVGSIAIARAVFT